MSLLFLKMLYHCMFEENAADHQASVENSDLKRLHIPKSFSALHFVGLVSNLSFITPCPLLHFLHPHVTVVLFCYTKTKASNIPLCLVYNIKMSNVLAEAPWAANGHRIRDRVLLRLASVINSRFTLTHGSSVNLAKGCSRILPVLHTTLQTVRMFSLKITARTFKWDEKKWA